MALLSRSAGGSNDDSLLAILIVSREAMYRQPEEKAEKLFCFFLIREKTISSPALECGRIRTVLATSFIVPNLWLPFPSFSYDRDPQTTCMRKLDDDFSSFSSFESFIQTFLGMSSLLRS